MQRLLLCLMIFVLPALAYAEIVTRKVGDIEINFPALQGYCILDENNQKDARIVYPHKTLASSLKSTVLAMAIKCEELSRLRRGSPNTLPSEYALYSITGIAESRYSSGSKETLRKEFCQLLRRQPAGQTSNFKEKAGQIFKDISASFPVNTIKDFGVIDEDQNGCYLGQLGSSHYDGKRRLSCSIVTRTFVRGKLLVLSLYYVNCRNIEAASEVLSLSKAFAAELDKVNP